MYYLVKMYFKHFLKTLNWWVTIKVVPIYVKFISQYN